MTLPEDNFTNTVSAAAAYERYRAKQNDPPDDIDYDRPPPSRGRCRCKGACCGPNCPAMEE